MFKSFRIAVLLTGALFAIAALAQPGPDAPPPPGAGGDQADPPSRVGRLSFIHGAVSFVPAGENEWVGPSGYSGTARFGNRRHRGPGYGRYACLRRCSRSACTRL